MTNPISPLDVRFTLFNKTPACVLDVINEGIVDNFDYATQTAVLVESTLISSMGARMGEACSSEEISDNDYSAAICVNGWIDQALSQYQDIGWIVFRCGKNGEIVFKPSSTYPHITG